MPSFIHTKVDPNRLSATAANIRESIQQLENAFKKIRQTLAGDSQVIPTGMALSANASGLLHTTWTGPASQQFYAQYRDDVEFFNSHMKVLNTLNTQLREAAGIYDGADSRAQELVRQLKIG